jgi:hypothetical protein
VQYAKKATNDGQLYLQFKRTRTYTHTRVIGFSPFFDELLLVMQSPKLNNRSLDVFCVNTLKFARIGFYWRKTIWTVLTDLGRPAASKYACFVIVVYEAPPSCDQPRNVFSCSKRRKEDGCSTLACICRITVNRHLRLSF